MERELLLLGLLRREDMHGYQLHEFINANMAAYHPATFAGNIGLAFMGVLPDSKSHALLHQWRDILATELAVMQSAPHHGGIMRLVIDHQVHHLSAELSWLDTVLARLSSQ